MSTEPTPLPLGDRMKGYEAVADVFLTRRMPLIVRIDGKAFHSWTRHVKADKPFDAAVQFAMGFAAEHLAGEAQGCVFGYIQSDEASFVLQDWWEHRTEPWLDKRTQKIASVAASQFTHWFNHCFRTAKVLFTPPAFFDARCFVLPEAEVCNYFIWRQQDATRNSIAALAQAHFSHKRLQGLNGDQMQELLFQERGINWSALPTWQKRGAAIVKADRGWTTDAEIPVFTQDREYIERRLRRPEDVPA